MITAIIFDCFGVILTDGLQMVYDEVAQHDPGAVQQIRGLIQAANRGIISPEESTPQVAAILNLSVDEYRQKVRSNEVRNQPLLTFIEDLRPKYKVGLLSNITVDGLRRRFPDSELATYFDAVTVSSEIGYAKPDRQAYEIAAERLGVTPGECVFIDDRLEFCDAARQAGMQAIEYRDFAQFKAELQSVLADE